MLSCKQKVSLLFRRKLKLLSQKLLLQLMIQKKQAFKKKMRGKARGEVAMVSTRQACAYNPRKNNNKKANNAESVAEAVSSSMAALVDWWFMPVNIGLTF